MSTLRWTVSDDRQSVRACFASEDHAQAFRTLYFPRGVVRDASEPQEVSHRVTTDLSETPDIYPRRNYGSNLQALRP